MNNVPQNKKDGIMKSLAIAGFIAIIALIAWLSVQLINIVPGAFSSLASLAEGLSNTQLAQEAESDPAELTVTSNETLVDAGETVRLSWNPATRPGTYTFSYACGDGIAIDLQDVAEVTSIACDTNYNIGDTDHLALVIDSEKERYADVVYTISFLTSTDTRPRASGEGTLTVVNREIPDLVAATNTPTNVSTSTADDETPAPETDQTATPPAPAPTREPEQQIISFTPVSDPNGRTDLGVRFEAVGTIVGNTFFPGQLIQEDAGALQFVAKNYGTKTSTDWTYTVTLPSGRTYTSPAQEPLRPNERAVLTLGFPTPDISSHTFTVSIGEDTDQNQLNDRFQKTVTLFE